MTDVRIESKVGGHASPSLDEHARRIYDNPGVKVLAIIEASHIERTQPAPESEKSPTVRLRINHMEIPTKGQEEYVRDAMKALYRQRTAEGTIDEEGEVQLSERTLKLTGMFLDAAEVARLRAGVEAWERLARVVANSPKDYTVRQMRKEVDGIAKGLAKLLDRSQPELTLSSD